jgi:hypothetical protein
MKHFEQKNLHVKLAVYFAYAYKFKKISAYSLAKQTNHFVKFLTRHIHFGMVLHRY